MFLNPFHWTFRMSNLVFIFQYRSRIFSMLPNLELVDNVDKEGNEAESEDEVRKNSMQILNHLC